jgi:hypothetical protein
MTNLEHKTLTLDDLEDYELLQSDKTFIKRKLANYSKNDKNKIIDKYAKGFIYNYNIEPDSRRKGNVARRKANSWIRENF